MVLVTRGGCTYIVPEGQESFDGPEGAGGSNGMGGMAGMSMHRVPAVAPNPMHRPRTLQSLFLQPDLHERYQGRTVHSMQHVPPEDDRHKEIPPRYHSIQPLDDPSTRRDLAGSLGYPGALYKVGRPDHKHRSHRHPTGILGAS